jgi:hypothetical protein
MHNGNSPNHESAVGPSTPARAAWPALYLASVDLINIDHQRIRVGATLHVTVQRRHSWVVTLSQKYPAHFATRQ